MRWQSLSFLASNGSFLAWRNDFRARLRVARVLAATTTAATFLLSSGAVLAGIVFQDISPDFSTFYSPSSAFGASGGRVNGLASVPGSNQTFYAASEWAGVFKTLDGGVTWFRLDRHLPVAVWDVAVDPSDPNIVYATSFFDGRVDPLSGIEVSYDAGDSWIRPATATPMPGVNADPAFSCSPDRTDEPAAFGIGIHPGAPQNVFVGTNCGLAMSQDSGVSWQFVDPTPGTSNCDDGSDACDVWDVVVQSGGTNGIVDICGEDGHWRSTDGGATWTGGSTDLPSGRCSIAVSPDEPYVLFVADDLPPNVPDHHYVYESDDAGQSWTRLGKPYPPDAHKRIPFLVTNKRSDDAQGNERFDLWYGEQDLWRASCTTPASPQMGGPPRCPSPSSWAGPPTGPLGPLVEYQGAHGDSGDLEFNRTVAVDACPLIFSSDGGVYYNTKTGAGCHDPQFAQPDVSPHGLWLWGMDGANQSGDMVDLYFGVQDDGAWATTNANDTPPIWKDGPTSDSFTMVADTNRVVWLGQDGLHVQGPGMVGGGVVNTPTTCLVSFRFLNAVDRFGDKKYVIVTAIDTRFPGCTTAGIYATDDITSVPVVWTQLGAATSPAQPCGVRASEDPASPGTPVFYVQDGSCNANIYDNQGDRLWKYTGTDPNGSWQRVDNQNLCDPVCQPMAGGVGIFGVDPHDADRLYASNLPAPPVGPRMVFSNDGGATWHRDTALDTRMTGGGQFKYRTERGATNDTSFFWTMPGYPQPSLVAFDPEDSNILVAGGRDSGVFLSTNGGSDWGLITDPFDSGNTGIPHIPRPWFAHFHHDASSILWLYIGTQGRGVWRIRIQPPKADAGGPYVTSEGIPVLLDASGSNDPDGQSLTYEWDLNGDGNFDDAMGPTPVFDAVGQDGAFPVSVKVTAGGVFSIASSTVTVTNVPPTVSFSSDAPVDEGSPLSVSGVVTDPGWLDPLSAMLDWGDGTPPEPVSGIYEGEPPDATLPFAAAHVYGDNGSFDVTICASDDDATTCQIQGVVIVNVDPTAVIDDSATVLVNGNATFIAHAGENLDFSGRSQDPGSDDLDSSWDWDDGAPAPDVTTTYLVNPPNSDPFPSPSVQPRDILDNKSHTFGQACFYEIRFLSLDDDGGASLDTANVVIVGNADRSRSAGFWKHQYGGRGRKHLDETTLACYLEIVGYMSQVFNEVRDASTAEKANEVLTTAGNGGDMYELLDRQLLAVWLNFANGAVALGDYVDTDGDGTPDTSFENAVTMAEAVRSNPAATRDELEMQKDILERINLSAGG